MHFRHFAAAFAAFVVLLLPAAVSAQSTAPVMPVGTWTGTVTPPEATTTPVTFNVKADDKAITIQIDAGEHGSFPASDVAFAGTKLSFTFTPGPKLLCVLKIQDDGSFAGECTEENGPAALITMVPPKQPGA